MAQPHTNVRAVFVQYDNGVTGGVISMPDFLERFFPDVLHDVSTDGQGAPVLATLQALPLNKSLCLRQTI